MKNIKQLLIVIAISILFTGAYGQNNFSISLSSGYHFGFVPHQFNGINNYEYVDSITYKVSTGTVFLGNGMEIEGTAHYSINKNMKINLGIGYLLGEKNYIRQTYKDSSLRYEIYSNMWLIKPGFSFSFSKNKLIYNATIGSVIALGSVVKDFHREKKDDVYYEKFEYSGGKGLGLFAEFSINYKLNNKISFFAKTGADFFTYMPTEGNITEAFDNKGTPQDVLNNIPENLRHETYSNEITYVNSNTPKEKLQPYFNMSAFTAQIGITYSIKTFTTKEDRPATKL